jgi:hypothetical protein
MSGKRQNNQLKLDFEAEVRSELRAQSWKGPKRSRRTVPLKTRLNPTR